MVFCEVMWLVIECNGTKCMQFLQRMNMYMPEQLVFVDETSCDQHTTNRSYGWAKEGEWASWRCFCVQGKQYVSKVKPYSI